MPNSKIHRRGTEEKNRKWKLSEKSSSFHGRIPAAGMAVAQLRRPHTVPDLLIGKNIAGISSPEERPRLTKLLLNVTFRGSVGAVQVVMTPESTVGDLIAVSLRQYTKEGRRPVLPTTDPVGFDLHYSQFSLESLVRDEKLIELGSRNFYLCPKKSTKKDGDDGDHDGSLKSSSCSKEAEKASKISLPWLKFMGFLL